MSYAGMPLLFVVNLKNGGFLFYPTPDHISPVKSLCILMFNLSVVFRPFHVDIQLIKSKNNYLLRQHKK